MTKYEPPIYINWFDTAGIEIDIDRADIRPSVMNVAIEQEGFGTIRQRIVTIWADPKKGDEFSSGPHLILLKP